MESISSSPNLDCVAASAVARRSCFLEPAPAVAVMWEQMEFLVDHAGPACSPNCPECLRLEQVRQCLMRPFDSVAPQPTQ
jgi:hypothetical protein